LFQAPDTLVSQWQRVCLVFFPESGSTLSSLRLQGGEHVDARTVFARMASRYSVSQNRAAARTESFRSFPRYSCTSSETRGGCRRSRTTLSALPSGGLRLRSEALGELH